MSTLLVGRIEGVCATSCTYDLAGVCTKCRSLDPSEYFTMRLPSKETASAQALHDDFAEVAIRHGLDPSILDIRRVY